MSGAGAATEGTLIQATEAAFQVGGALGAASPDYRRRDAQVELAGRIAEAIAGDGTLIAEAGTGIGKTFAYLVPALLARRRVLISTGTRQLQDQLFQRDIGIVRRALAVDVEAAVLKGRANYVCPLHLKRNLVDGRFRDPTTPGKLRIIERFASVDPTGDRAACVALAEDDPVWQLATSTKDNCLGQECPELRHCPLMKARQKAQRVDVLVVNHHLFCADLALKEDAIGDFLPRADVLVFDEAHQLPETATDFFGESVSTRQLIDLGRDALRAGLTDARDAADWRALFGGLELARRSVCVWRCRKRSSASGLDDCACCRPARMARWRRRSTASSPRCGDSARRSRIRRNGRWTWRARRCAPRISAVARHGGIRPCRAMRSRALRPRWRGWRDDVGADRGRCRTRRSRAGDPLGTRCTSHATLCTRRRCRSRTVSGVDQRAAAARALDLRLGDAGRCRALRPLRRGHGAAGCASRLRWQSPFDYPSPGGPVARRRDIGATGIRPAFADRVAEPIWPLGRRPTAGALSCCAPCAADGRSAGADCWARRWARRLARRSEPRCRDRRLGSR